MPKASTCALIAILAFGELARGGPARAEPANSLNAMFTDLNHCLATVKLVSGTDITIRFMLNRRGGLIGKPRITHAQWTGDEADRKTSAASIADGFDHCMPVSITDALGGAIAGRPIAYRFRAPTAREDKA